VIDSSSSTSSRLQISFDLTAFALGVVCTFGTGGSEEGERVDGTGGVRSVDIEFRSENIFVWKFKICRSLNYCKCFEDIAIENTFFFEKDKEQGSVRMVPLALWSSDFAKFNHVWDSPEEGGQVQTLYYFDETGYPRLPNESPSLLKIIPR
jgi:hypothetical protein